MSLTRRDIREKALQSLFQLSANEDLSKEVAMQKALANHTEDKDELEDVEIPSYLNELVSGVIEQQEMIDSKINSHLKNWSINRLAKTDLLVMRIAVYEMLFVEDVPNKVALNEALEIIKRYSDEKSSKFVNGILSNMIEEKKED
ncbi:transcription antitermination factor NusB [Desemzia incerta]|uniref:transcription antitermination factor NusB n=1 Tax=Desemzia incerta TaxID=82801 RepID=UPI0024C30537|nr:transcription antitermination factor NusB [Desemzia incerta]WHZ31271.1 transcription antitermination factor NusB [Desemzia incerta]